ncbi:glycosyltransferase family 2 protein [Priestia flexa]|uniref:glycosyltransferase family 2 protein n=1 Tax=Priestia flexa TaxID=86664 RepID=UPI0011A58748|nr:glycosyltransferase family 2 protein [Priestia flexa]MCG7314007.1 glycosyltransferase [Priestia flexa]UZW66166.1 glycosyltransferase [Priestia flexa]
MIDISIIVPIYKVEKYLVRCIEGILAQTFTNFELILVNDGSPDNSGEICDQYNLKDSRIKVIHQENQGTGFARNSGLKVASGKYIYFCDPDDYLEVNLLKDNFKLAEKHNANMVVFGYWDEMYTRKGKQVKLQTYNSKFLETQKEFRLEFRNLYETAIMFTLWNKLYRREYLEKHNYWFSNQRVGQDTVFNYLVYEKLDRVYVNNKAYYHYIIDRLDSAINLYRPNRFQIRYEETLKFEHLISKWESNKEYEKVILNDWAITLSVGLNNLFYSQAPLNNKQRAKEIKLYLDTEKIKWMLKNISIKNIENKFLKADVLLLKINFVNGVIFFRHLRNIIKKIVR